MRILLFEVGEKEGVGEVLKAGGIIRHAVDLAWEVEGQVMVAVDPLVLTCPIAEVCSCPVGCHRALADPGDGRGVIGAVD